MERVLRALLAGPAAAHPAETLAEFWAAHVPVATAYELPVDRAAIGGLHADRLGFAFAAGYHGALAALYPALGVAELAGLLATERGGNHPRAIASQLARDADGSYRLSGEKSWGTLAPLASTLIVVARTGQDAEGRPQLRAARVARDAPGVSLAPLDDLPFVPEVPHAVVTFDRVRVAASDVLPGDGYASVLKPFRTIEDLHVVAAQLGHWIGLGRRHQWDRARVAELAALFVGVRALAQSAPDSPAVHLALAGAFDTLRSLGSALEAPLAALPEPERTRWERDRALLGVAGKARVLRTEAAWRALLQ